MGTILQERVPQQQHHPGRVSVTEREWKKASRSVGRPAADRHKMGRRQSQRRTLQNQDLLPRQENTEGKKLHQRPKHKPCGTKHNVSLQSVQGTSESDRVHPGEDRKEVKVQPSAQRCGGERKLTTSRGSRHTPAFPCYTRTEPCPHPSDGISPNPESSHGESDSDTDLSELERLPVLRAGRVPPQLELRPEVIEADGSSPRGHRPRGHSHSGFDFPDFLPPPFNSWSLSQLAVFYHMEGRGTPRPRPMGPLERYLERLLQLEWHQIQTFQEKSGKSDVLPGCQRSPASTSSRLSSPKRILQCQRAFPLTFLSCLASHSVPLPGGISCCSRSTHGHIRQSRLGPLMEHRGPTSLPRRSYSESRVHSSGSQRSGSPARTTSHLRRMQASGNIRNLSQDANARPLSHTRDASIDATGGCLPGRGDMSDHRTGGFRRRSGSEQRTGRLERRGVLEKRQSGSECRRGGAERRREIKELEIKPDAVAAIMDNLPGSKKTLVKGLNRARQVEFVT
ncbi:uncharacterized protein [Antennarius striatus]|uniref:uncharacterized protein n=1 Tax=Antennarius striatus TaxID=241820 RepID=UPI0035AF0593